MSETPRPTFVSFNFKTEGGATCRFALTGKNFIVGPNGSGKSAIAQAVGLSVSGAADDVAGRAVTSDPGLLLGMSHQRGFDGNMSALGGSYLTPPSSTAPTSRSVRSVRF